MALKLSSIDGNLPNTGRLIYRLNSREIDSAPSQIIRDFAQLIMEPNEVPHFNGTIKWEVIKIDIIQTLGDETDFKVYLKLPSKEDTPWSYAATFKLKRFSIYYIDSETIET